MGNPFKSIQDMGVAAVAQSLGGIKLIRKDNLRHGMGPCPICRQKTRHRKSRGKRGAIGLRPDNMGWQCFQCNAKGNAVNMAAAIVTGRTRHPQGSRQWPLILARCEEAGLLQRSCHKPVPLSSKIATAQERHRPPEHEVRAVWEKAKGVADDTQASLWLLDRKLGIDRVHDGDLVRVIPQFVTPPRWAYRGGALWSENDFRLIAPLFDTEGRLSSIHARSLNPHCAPSMKAASPAGFTLAGLVMACPLAQAWLKDERLLDGSLASKYVAKVGLLITEGLPDYLTWASQHSDADEDAPAVLGIFSGSWTQAFANKVPSGCSVVIATDHDDAGERYAQKIIGTLRHRMMAGDVIVKRQRPYGGAEQ